MYLSVGVVAAILVVLASPVLCVGWWLIADLGERTNGAYSSRYREQTEAGFRRAA